MLSPLPKLNFIHFYTSFAGWKQKDCLPVYLIFQHNRIVSKQKGTNVLRVYEDGAAAVDLAFEPPYT